jgi:hypothetical protein
MGWGVHLRSAFSYSDNVYDQENCDFRVKRRHHFSPLEGGQVLDVRLFMNFEVYGLF